LTGNRLSQALRTPLSAENRQTLTAFMAGLPEQEDEEEVLSTT
jgi:hypothetical protein